MKKAIIIPVILIGAAVLLTAFVPKDDEMGSDLKAMAGQVGKFNNNPVKEMTTLNFHDVEYTVYPLKNKKTDIGTVIQTSATGFAGPIVVMVAFKSDGTIAGYKVLQHSETPRWGDVVGTWFQRSGQGNIIGLSMKDGDLKDRKDGGTVDGITNSTITTRAFLHAVNSAYKVYKGEEPEKQVIQQGRHGHGGGRPGFPQGTPQ